MLSFTVAKYVDSSKPESYELDVCRILDRPKYADFSPNSTYDMDFNYLFILICSAMLLCTNVGGFL